MTIPPAPLQPRIDELLTGYADELNVSVADLSTQDLQDLAYALRLKDIEEGDTPQNDFENDPDHDLACAQSLDALSDLQPEDVDYLETVGRAAVSAP